MAELAWKQDAAARQQSSQQRKLEKIQSEKAKIERMTSPEQQRKAEEKLRKRQIKKNGPSATVRKLNDGAESCARARVGGLVS